jgi:polyisoprenoid-binding protein YceI
MTTAVFTTLIVVAVLGFVPSPSLAPRLMQVAGGPSAIGGPPDTLIVNPRASSIHWKGSGLGGRAAREGTLGMSGGMFVLRHEQLTSGVFTVDMTRLDPALRSEELFDVARYPEASFTSTGMKRLSQARWQVSGNLTMHGVTQPITFDTDVRWEELGHMIATTSFTLDRRQWGVGTHGSAFGGGAVDDGIQLSITLDARRKQAAVATR